MSSGFFFLGPFSASRSHLKVCTTVIIPSPRAAVARACSHTSPSFMSPFAVLKLLFCSIALPGIYLMLFSLGYRS